MRGQLLSRGGTESGETLMVEERSGQAEPRGPTAWWTGRPQYVGAELDSLSADRELLQMAVKDDFCGPVGVRLTTHLVRYGLPLMSRLIQSGGIFDRLRELLSASGQRFYLPPRDLASEEVNMLAYDSVHNGLQILIRGERAGKGWAPEGGASLTTYFGNCCILGFRTPWKRMVSEMRRSDPGEELGVFDDVWMDLPDLTPGPEQRTISLHEIQRILVSIPGKLNQQILAMSALGFSHAAIGEVLGMKEHAVGERLRRLRKRNQTQPTDDDEGGI